MVVVQDEGEAEAGLEGVAREIEQALFKNQLAS